MGGGRKEDDGEGNGEDDGGVSTERDSGPRSPFTAKNIVTSSVINEYNSDRQVHKRKAPVSVTSKL